jgi:hypothetical protein
MTLPTVQHAIDGPSLIEATGPSTVLVLGRPPEKYEVWNTPAPHEYAALRRSFLTTNAEILTLGTCAVCVRA